MTRRHQNTIKKSFFQVNAAFKFGQGRKCANVEPTKQPTAIASILASAVQVFHAWRLTKYKFRVKLICT
jgi:hypothetical protein